jgi:hypothetical protein
MPSAAFLPRPCVPVCSVLVVGVVEHTCTSTHANYGTKIDCGNRSKFSFHHQSIKDAEKDKSLQSLKRGDPVGREVLFMVPLLTSVSQLLGALVKFYLVTLQCE